MNESGLNASIVGRLHELRALLTDIQPGNLLESAIFKLRC